MILLAVVVFLPSCSFFKTPFDYNIGKFNETSPQQPAAITLSDPQVFARETLINDRLQEQKFLTELLKESEDLKFRDIISAPALIRDVETLEAFRAAADLNFDPAKGQTAQRQERLDNLQNQIDLTKKETELANAKKDLEKARTPPLQTPANGTTPAAGTPAAPAGGAAQPAPAPAGTPAAKLEDKSDPNPTRATALLGELKGRITEIQGRLDKLGTTFGARKVTVPVPDAERARDAYRAELRQRLNATNLDDLHDYNGNGLYRLQFRASVMPGQHKDKFGIARVTFSPPLLSDEDLDALYRTWLNHLAFRLNQPLPDIRRSCPQPVAALSRLDQAELFELVLVYYNFDKLGNPTGISFTAALDKKPTSNETEESCTLHVPLPYTLGESFKSLADRVLKGQSVSGENVALIKSHMLPILEVIRTANQDHSPTYRAAGSLINTIRNISPKAVSDSEVVKLTSGFAQIVKAPSRFKDILTETIEARKGKGKGAVGVEQERGKAFAPSGDNIRTHIWEEQKSYDSQIKYVAGGTAHVYTAAPLEKSQRISTHAQAARSAELALSIAAQLATKGVSGAVNFGMIRQSAGIAEGFENQPIVIGFAERRAMVEQQLSGADPYYGSDYQAPQAGWVFGPEVRLDPEKNQLQTIHRFVAHEVSVDLSVPGWWPRVRATLETAWIGNLHNTGRPIRLEDEAGQGFQRKHFVVSLPVNVADLDGLTAIIARKTVGTFLPTISIQHVDPFFISACSKEVNVLVKGSNVWRGTRAFLGGIEADNVAVLPDMEGIAAKFSLDKLFATKNDSVAGLSLDQGVRLFVWTRNGSDSITLRLQGNRESNSETCIGRTTVSSNTSLQRFELVSISPAQICAESKVASFLIKGANVDPSTEVTAIFGASVLEKQKPAQGDVFRLTFSGGPFGAPLSNVPMSMTNGREISFIPVRLVQCQKPENHK